MLRLYYCLILHAFFNPDYPLHINVADYNILFIIQTDQRAGKSDYHMQYQELMFVSYFP